MIDQTQRPSIAELEDYRKFILGRKILFFVLISIGLILIASIFFFDNISWSVCFVVAIGFIFGGCIVNRSATDHQTEYAYQYKEIVVQPFINQLGLIYSPNQGIELEDFKSSHLWSIWPDNLVSQDQITGRSKNVLFEFSQVKAQYKVISTVSRGGKHEHWYTLFKGIVHDVKFPERLRCQAIIRTRSWFSLPRFDWRSSIMLNGEEYKIVTFENTTFSKSFKVYSMDKVSAQQILIPVLNNLLKLKAYTRSDVSVSFINNRAFFALALKHKYFEPPVYKKIQGLSLLQSEQKVISGLLDLIGHLNQNFE